MERLDIITQKLVEQDKRKYAYLHTTDKRRLHQSPYNKHYSNPLGRPTNNRRTLQHARYCH